jgi:Ca2+-binding EF-hand superfamily protein
MTTRSLSPEQLEALKAQFDVIDLNGDGRISIEELSVLLRREAYAHLSDRQRQEIVESYASVDADGDGAVSFDEFVELVTRAQDPRAAFRQAFDAYDLDGDGFLTTADFQRIAEQQGGALTAEQAEAMVRMADVNADGKVSFDEYYAILTSGSSGSSG